MSVFKDCGCGCDGREQKKKFIISFISALIFFLLASPEMFQLTRRVFGGWVAGPTGCSSTLGVVLHAIVFLLVTWSLMNLKK